MIEIPQGFRIDWFRVIVELERCGQPHLAIACEVGVSRRTVGGWKDGREPSHDDGTRLLGMWCRVTGERQELAPVVSKYSHRA